MATSYAIRSFRNALLAIVLVGSLTTACKKSGLGGADVDPRDQFVGTYDGGYQASTLVNNSLESSRESGKVTVTITKSEVAKQFYIDLLFNGTSSQKLTAEMTDNTFTVIDKQSETLVFDGKPYPNSKYTATGQFVEKDFLMNTVTETLASGVTISRRGSITGTKK
jgi:hypothetical protein